MKSVVHKIQQTCLKDVWIKIWDSVYMSMSYIRSRGLNHFINNSKNAIGIGWIWTRGCSLTNDASNSMAGCFNFLFNNNLPRLIKGWETVSSNNFWKAEKYLRKGVLIVICVSHNKHKYRSIFHKPCMTTSIRVQISQNSFAIQTRQ